MWNPNLIFEDAIAGHSTSSMLAVETHTNWLLVGKLTLLPQAIATGRVKVIVLTANLGQAKPCEFVMQVYRFEGTQPDVKRNLTEITSRS